MLSSPVRAEDGHVICASNILYCRFIARVADKKKKKKLKSDWIIRNDYYRSIACNRIGLSNKRNIVAESLTILERARFRSFRSKIFAGSARRFASSSKRNKNNSSETFL